MPASYATNGRRPVTFVVDPAMCNVRTAAGDGFDLDGLVRTGMRDHFCGTSGAEYWNALCQAPEYGHRHLLKLIDDWFPAALRAADLRPVLRDRPLRLASLGPGNGEIDVRLIGHLETGVEHVAYSCIDSSFELLRRAVSRIANAEELRSRFPIQACCGDFTAAEVTGAKDRGDLLALLGGTLGNYREDELMGHLRRWTTPDSLLLIDAWLWTPDRRAANGLDCQPTLTNKLTFVARNRFVFGPVEAATTATTRDVTFHHEVNRDVTVVPGAINIVTYCSHLHTRDRLTDEPIDRDRLPLAGTTRYEFEALTEWFGTAGYDVIWRQNAGLAGVFLLRPAFD